MIVGSSGTRRMVQKILIVASPLQGFCFPFILVWTTAATPARKGNQRQRHNYCICL